jgi:uncharacterized zinc-type alcohol dehydrogenase-like protein
MSDCKAYAAKSATTPLEPFNFARRDVAERDVQIEILFCGVCHSDIHTARNEWHGTVYPTVPGHEIVGRVTKVGDSVTHYQVGDLAGVGCFVNSCQKCESCSENEEQFCHAGCSFTYNSTEQDKETITQGGYSDSIVVDERYVLKISPKLPLANVAPLLCAGITTYSPLRQFKVGPGQKVGIIGLGGLGHMGVKIAAAMGAEVTVLSKEMDAVQLGAKYFINTRDAANFEKYQNHFDLLLDTVSAVHDLNAYIGLLNKGGVMVMVGAPEKPLPLSTFGLIHNRRRIAGSLIGGIKETQEMLDFCAQHNITADVEIIPMQKINEAYERTIKSDVKYRFVIDMKTL